MKRVVLLNILLAFTVISWNSYGQELVSTKCNPLINSYGFKDKISGETVIPCSYYSAGNFSEQIEGLAKVSQNIAPPHEKRAILKYGFIDKTGKEVIPLNYDEIYKFSDQIEGLALVKLGAFYGFIDKMGKEVIRPKYSEPVFKFSEELAVVRSGNLFGFIDKTGREVIPCKYEYAGHFFEGLAEVTYMTDRGYIDVAGEFYSGDKRSKVEKKVAPKKESGAYDAILAQIAQADEVEKQRLADARAQEIKANAAREKTAREERERQENMLKFPYFAKKYVEDKINIWQIKGEFEPTADWKNRVNDDTRKTKAKEFQVEAEQEYIKERSKNFNVGNMTLGTYDPDNQTYLIKNNIHGDWLVYVPISEAPNFKESWNTLKKEPQFAVINDNIGIAGMDFTTRDKTYKYSNQESLNYNTITNIDYNFAPIDINTGSSQNTPQGKQNISTVGYSAGNLSDVASNIPTTGARNENTFAVIIANENYHEESKVEFAKNDGETFKKYCIQTLGLPANNVKFIADATLNNILREINWLNQIAEAYKGEASIIFYYAGHGIPDESTKTSYLLPVDGFGSDVKSGYSLERLYQTLGKMNVKSVIVFMDACFSGAQRSGEMMVAARGIAIKTTQGEPVGNMVVFSAAQGDETAFPYREKGHGMFTYFLLKKLQETKGESTLGELSDYITDNVKKQSIVVNRKSQTPTVTPSATMAEKWKGMKLK